MTSNIIIFIYHNIVTANHSKNSKQSTNLFFYMSLYLRRLPDAKQTKPKETSSIT